MYFVEFICLNLHFVLQNSIMASNKGLSDNEILNQLFPEDVDVEEMGQQSGVKDLDTEVESCSEAKDELEGWGHSLHYRAGSARKQPPQVVLPPS